MLPAKDWERVTAAQPVAAQEGESSEASLRALGSGQSSVRPEPQRPRSRSAGQRPQPWHKRTATLRKGVSWGGNRLVVIVNDHQAGAVVGKHPWVALAVKDNLERG